MHAAPAGRLFKQEYVEMPEISIDNPDVTALATIAFARELAPTSVDPVQVYLRSRASKRSRETMTDCLKRISAIPQIEDNGGISQVIWSKFTYAHAEAIRADLIGAEDEFEETLYSPATINVTLSALRGVLETALNLDLISFEACIRAKKGLKSVKGTRLPPGRALADAEIAQLRAYTATLEGHYGAMTRGIVAVLMGGGLRRAEVCGARLDKYARPCIDVIGKGNKERRVTLSEDALADLEAWIVIRRGLNLQMPSLFVRILRDQTIHPRALSTDVLYAFVRELGERSGLGKLSTHDFRRTCATRQLDNGVDLRLVQQNLGHEDPKTTGKYDRRGEREMKKAIDRSGVY